MINSHGAERLNGCTTVNYNRSATILSCDLNTVVASDGIPISFSLYRRGTRDTVLIICPGFFKSKEAPTFQQIARVLAENRDVLCMDFRGHGRSGGFYTFSAREHADLEAVLAFAREHYAHIAVLGFSLGAAIAINTLSRNHERVRGLVTVSAPCIFEEIEFKVWTPKTIYQGLRRLERGSGCRPGNLFLKKKRTIDHIGSLQPMPILIIHGERDVIVGVGHSHQLYAAAQEPKRLEIIEGGNHAEILFRDNPQGFIRLMEGWFSETLGK